MFEGVFMDWGSFSKEKKLRKFGEFACHELHFFLFKRDRGFFDEVVLPFISAKMEKSFLDWYLLSYTSDSDNLYVQ